jgi:DUF4097 and DUF4098 domain-containing protein YvlB
MAERVRITVGSGRVEVISEARDAIAVEGATATTGGELETVVRGGSDSFRVRVPIGTDVVVGSESGDVVLAGRFGAVSITTSSADVRVEEVGSIDARSHSGKLEVELSHGPVRLGSQSATIRIGRAEGEVRIASDSGRIEIAAAAASVAAKTVSGTIVVTATGAGPLRLETVSGTIEVSVPDGVRPNVRHRSVSGQLDLDVETGDDLEITARSVSGDLTVGVT